MLGASHLNRGTLCSMTAFRVHVAWEYALTSSCELLGARFGALDDITPSLAGTHVRVRKTHGSCTDVSLPRWRVASRGGAERCMILGENNYAAADTSDCV